MVDLKHPLLRKDTLIFVSKFLLQIIKILNFLIRTKFL